MTENLRPVPVPKKEVIFMDVMDAAAQEYGLGTIPAYMLAIYPDMIRAELEIPEDLSIVIGVALGYGDAKHPQNKFRSSRRTIEEVVRFKGF